MKKFLEYIKTSSKISKVLMIIWLVFAVIMTLGMMASDKGENVIDDVFSLTFMYTLFGAMFLIPAITINQAIKGKTDISDSTKAKSTWITTFLLCLFLGNIGAHRFYTGRKITGFIYLFTMGGFGLANFTDLILLIMGKYTDKNGFFVKNNTNKQTNQVVVSQNGNNRTTNTSSYYSALDAAKKSFEKTKSELNQKKEEWVNDGKEKLKQWKKDNNEGFSDVVLDGAEERTQSIPSANIETLGRNSTSSSGLTISIKPVISRDENGDFSIDFDFDDDSPYSSSKFIKDMAKFENKVGKEAPFIPFMQYWPSYDSMTKQQKDWYFYWRSQVRKGIYLNTDLSYIFVHVYELLSGYGWTNAQDGYDQLIALWINYRREHIRLDNYLVGWLFDFAQLHKLEYAIPEGIEITLPYQLAIRDLLIDKHSDEKPLKLPFPLIDALCDYSLAGSKFYKDGHQLLMNEAIPRVVALADAALIKKKGKGILETYGPNRPKKQTYYAFQSANCVHANKRMDISVKGYTSSQKLRGYINELVRYAENVLRELYDCRGRLRGVTLDDETSSLVKAFLKKEYSPNRKPIEPEKKKEVKLDFESINELRNQSDAIRDALEVTEEKIEAKELLTDLDAVKEIFVSMPPYCRMLIDEMRSKSWEMEYNSSVQASIEKINELSGMQLACSIVVVEGNTLILEDDYRDEFNYIYEHLSEIEIPESSEEKDTISKFDLTALSDEMKQLLETLTPAQEEILHIILSQENMSQRIEEIANAEMSMPEILIDEINDIATQYIGDILIDTFDAEMSVLEQYVNELKEAMK